MLGTGAIPSMWKSYLIITSNTKYKKFDTKCDPHFGRMHVDSVTWIRLRLMGDMLDPDGGYGSRRGAAKNVLPFYPLQ